MQSDNDHDILIRLVEKVDNLIEEVRSMKTDISGRVSDHESRIRRLELWGFIAVGVLYAIQFYFNYIK